MSPNARGRLYALLAVGAFAVTAWLLLFRRSAPDEPPAPPPPLTASAPHPLPTDCAGLRAEYQNAWEHVVSCNDDSDCVAEHRAELWSDLDGCARFGRLHGVDPEQTEPERARADDIAQAWLRRGCARSYELCEAAPLARCLAGRCAERPPAGIPADWRPVRIPGLVSFWLPPSWKEERVHPEDSVANVWMDGKRRFSVGYGQWEPGPEPDPEDPFSRPAGQRAIRLFDAPSVLYFYDVAEPLPDGGVKRSFAARAGRKDLRTDHMSMLLMQDQRGGTLLFFMECDTRPGCQELGTIVESARLLTYVLERDP